MHPQAWPRFRTLEQTELQQETRTRVNADGRAHSPVAGHVTAQEFNRGLSGDHERFFGSGRNEGLTQRKASHAGLAVRVMVSSHRFFSCTG